MSRGERSKGSFEGTQ